MGAPGLSMFFLQRFQIRRKNTVNEQILKNLKGATQAAQPCKDPFSASVEKKPKRILAAHHISFTATTTTHNL